ncbi:MAG: hypothetical protein IPN87_17120 [Saprospiraceae bacterium]|nr:hypothetical protein [Candidatus Brachybacter algidus]
MIGTQTITYIVGTSPCTNQAITSFKVNDCACPNQATSDAGIDQAACKGSTFTLVGISQTQIVLPGLLPEMGYLETLIH